MNFYILYYISDKKGVECTCKTIENNTVKLVDLFFTLRSAMIIIEMLSRILNLGCKHSKVNNSKVNVSC